MQQIRLRVYKIKSLCLGNATTYWSSKLYTIIQLLNICHAKARQTNLIARRLVTTQGWHKDSHYFWLLQQQSWVHNSNKVWVRGYKNNYEIGWSCYSMYMNECGYNSSLPWKMNIYRLTNIEDSHNESTSRVVWGQHWVLVPKINSTSNLDMSHSIPTMHGPHSTMENLNTIYQSHKMTTKWVVRTPTPIQQPNHLP